MVTGFASNLGVDIADDLKHLGRLLPSLAQLDSNGHLISHIQDHYGADFFYSRVDYFNDRNRLQAYRVIARISEGKRTKLAYWPKSATFQKINVHRGQGYLIISDPDDNEITNGLNTVIYSVSSEVTPIVFLPPGRFYTLQAASWSSEPFIVSALCQMNEAGEWGDHESLLEPGNETLTTTDGIVEVPDDFISGSFI